jgi:hypothetical protein
LRLTRYGIKFSPYCFILRSRSGSFLNASKDTRALESAESVNVISLPYGIDEEIIDPIIDAEDAPILVENTIIERAIGLTSLGNR